MNVKQNRNSGTSFGIFFALTAMLVAPILLLSESTIGIQKAYADNNWYLGKGAKANTYYTYKIQDHDTKESQPFIMTIYLKQFDRQQRLLDCAGVRDRTKRQRN